MAKIQIDLGTVQETALFTLWAKAIESQKPNPTLIDKKSVEILNAIDYNFERYIPGQAFVARNCLRTTLLDQWVKNYIAEHPEGCVVEIGAGLSEVYPIV
jgi:O-methyltransferase involved in polyketide biosynthesis